MASSMTPKKMEQVRPQLIEICADGTRIAGVFEMLDVPDQTVIHQLRKACMASGNLHWSLRPREDAKHPEGSWRLTIRTEAKRAAGSTADALTAELRRWVQVCR